MSAPKSLPNTLAGLANASPIAMRSVAEDSDTKAKTSGVQVSPFLIPGHPLPQLTPAQIAAIKKTASRTPMGKALVEVANALERPNWAANRQAVFANLTNAAKSELKPAEMAKIEALKKMLGEIGNKP